MSHDRSNPPSHDLQRGIVALLRGDDPREAFEPSLVERGLRRYECGGYIDGLWKRRAPGRPLPSSWAGPIAQAQRKTAIDNLGALGEFRHVGAFLVAERIPFVLLKGTAYLIDLYDDPGERPLTDIDLLVRPDDVRRVARHLAQSGYEGSVDPWYPESRRFEMVRGTGTRCRFEFHWQLGLERRFRVDQDALWKGAREARLEGLSCRILGREDAILYHVGHLADHYFGPTLKWILDLREMLSRWRPDPALLADRARQWRVRIALYLALLHLDRLFPGETPDGLIRRVAPGSTRRALLQRLLSDAPAELMAVDAGSVRRFYIRPQLLDSPWDAALLSMQVIGRPAMSLLRRLRAPAPLPWESAG